MQEETQNNQYNDYGTTGSQQPIQDQGMYGDQSYQNYGTPADTQQPLDNSSYSSDFSGDGLYYNTPQEQGFDTQSTQFNGYSSPLQSTELAPNDIQFPATSPEPNTFEQKKTGSKLFLYGSIAVVVILLIAMGVLSYFNFFANRDNNSTTQTATTTETKQEEPKQEEPKQEEVSTTFSTGPDTTPASKSRVNSESELPKSWLLKHFTSPNIDTQGDCLVVTTCGKNADPDNDGANNLVEYNFSTDPINNDTDLDGIADGDELFVYYSSPKSKLSDSDSFADGVELTGCYDMISTSASRMNTDRRAQIASSVKLSGLHEPTITLLNNNKAIPADIKERGVILAVCQPSTPSTTTPTTSTTTPTTSPATTN